MLPYRPGSVEVTAALTIRKDGDVAYVEQALDTFNKSGMFGSTPWTASYWGSNGNTETYKPSLLVSVLFEQRKFRELRVHLDLDPAVSPCFN